MLLLLLACSPPPVAITVSPTVQGAGVSTCEPLDVEGRRVVVRDLRWFVHDVQVVGVDGVAHPLLLDEGPWQHDGMALLDHEDGCFNGTKATHPTLTGRSRAIAPFRALRLTVGLPPAANHADPLSLQPPLTTTSMHWGWRQGFKYVRLDLAVDDEPLRVHLGATGCEGPMGAVTGCTQDHLGTLELPLEGSIASLELGPALQATTTGCMATSSDDACTPWFAAFGIDEAPRQVGRTP